MRDVTYCVFHPSVPSALELHETESKQTQLISHTFLHHPYAVRSTNKNNLFLAT